MYSIFEFLYCVFFLDNDTEITVILSVHDQFSYKYST